MYYPQPDSSRTFRSVAEISQRIGITPEQNGWYQKGNYTHLIYKEGADFVVKTFSVDIRNVLGTIAKYPLFNVTS